MQNKAWSIGRLDSNRCDILLQGDSISSVHATLNFQNGRFFVIDNDSTNGTYIIRDNQKYSITEHTEIYPSDIVLFGQSEYRLDDLIEHSNQVEGTSTNSLVVVEGMSASAKNNYQSQGIVKVVLASEISPKQDSKVLDKEDNSKKIRCYECTTVISINKPCHECGSQEHMEDLYE